MTQPNYYKALWHNCNRCHIHYMSEHPHIRAYLCDECWNSIPHFVVKAPQVKRRKIQKNEWSWKEIALYTLGNLSCLVVIGYYLWFK
jgi:hypothetical protein